MGNKLFFYQVVFSNMAVGSYLQVMMMVFSPSQEGLSAMTLAWVVTSWGDSCGDSLGWVWIQPRGSISCWAERGER